MTWSKMSGPGSMTFANPNAVSARTTFSMPGVYLLRLSAGETGVYPITFDEVELTVEASRPCAGALRRSV